ncbi:MAG: hypothetical protein QOG30_168 [Acidimicrobiaceae bacterium]
MVAPAAMDPRPPPRTPQKMTFRPKYAVGDRITLYVTQPHGPGRIPAILEVTREAYDGRTEIEAAYGKKEAARYGWITPVSVIRTTSIDHAPGLDSLAQDPKGLQNGRARVRDRGAPRNA